MKILAVIGSPNGMKGSTGRLLSAVLQGARSTGAEIETCSLADLKVHPCGACGSCHRTGKCPIPDDLQSIEAAALGAEGIVLASPNYIFSVTAQMKAFLDRSCGPLHCQAWEGKYGAAVVTSGGGGGEEVEAYLLRFLRAMGCRTVGSIGALGRQLQGDSADQVTRAAAALGANLVASIRSARKFPEQSAERQAFVERMRQLVTMQKDIWPYEYEYWKSHGRL
jgi:multimeric flavodoxin WrbA